MGLVGEYAWRPTVAMESEVCASEQRQSWHANPASHDSLAWAIMTVLLIRLADEAVCNVSHPNRKCPISVHYMHSLWQEDEELPG